MHSAQRPNQRGSASAQHALARLSVPIAVTFVAANLLLLFAVKASGIEQQAVDVQTRLVYRARLDGFFARPAPARAVFLGDSLVYGAHLREREGAGWESHTLSSNFARLSRERSGRAVAALNLGINGVLFSDLACVVADVLARRPEVLVLGISPRPFSSDFAKPGAESARPFLCPSHATQPLLRINELGSELAYRSLPIYRYRDLLQFHYLDTTPRALVVDQLLAHLPKAASNASTDSDAESDADEQAVLAQMLQRMRAAQRFNSVEVSASHPQARGLEQLLQLLRAQPYTRVLVFYLRENLALLGDAVDTSHYAAASASFIAKVQRALAGASKVRFVVADAADYAGEYTDHIHLTAAGYARLAARVVQELPP